MGTVRPLTEDGDDFYGLALGTNGTAAAMRRLCANAPPSYRWLRRDGRPATGLRLRPATGETKFVNPWTLEESKR